MLLTKSSLTLICTLLFDLKQMGCVSLNQNSSMQSLQRQKRLFSLFNIVRFANDPCTATSNMDLAGTCFSAQECAAQGGAADGNCAAGFGVCCVFTITGCGGMVNRNCTFVRNAGFPGADTNNARTCSVMLNRFTNGSCGGTGDSLSVISPHSSSRNAFPPAICGALTGQHLYFESGRMGSTAGQIDIFQGSGAAERRYNIKVSYIPCNSRVRAPSGCTQFFTEDTGTISSYNFQGGQLLGDQVYSNCIRQNDGFCAVQYAESHITSPDPFDLDRGLTQGVTDNCMTRNHVTIPSRVIDVIRTGVPQIPGQGGNAPTPAASQQDIVTIAPSMRCDTVFGSAPRSTIPGTLTSLENVPFVVNLRTLPSAGGGVATFSGFTLDYAQVPC